MSYIFYITPQAEIAGCSKAFWEENGVLDDRFDAGFFAIMTKLGFSQLRTNVFQRPRHRNIQEARAILIEAGLEEVSDR